MQDVMYVVCYGASNSKEEQRESTEMAEMDCLSIKDMTRTL